MNTIPRPATWKDLSRRYLPQVVQFLQDLVRIQSVNGRENEQAVALRITEEAQRLGFRQSLVALQPGRPNALVEWGQGPASFILLGHMDTVSEGQAGLWKLPPFDAAIQNGRLYGRGAADNKAGIACGLYTLAYLRDNKLLDPEKVRVILAGVVDEESGASSHLGVRFLLDKGYLPRARGAIYTYTSDIICIGHRGLLRLLVCATGRSIHTGSNAWSRGEGGVNAVTGLGELLLLLEKLPLKARTHPAFHGLRCKMTPGTTIQGGDYESMVPASAKALVDVRLMPGQSAEEVIAAVEGEMARVERRRPGLGLTVEVKNNLPGVVIDRHDPLVKIAKRWTKAITGKSWSVAGAGPANEGYMLIQADIPTLCGFGPTGGNAHAPDEWVDIESLGTTIAMYTGIVHDCLMVTR